MLKNIRILILSALVLSSSLGASAATVTVVNTNDTGAGSLRDAITNANNGDTINFSIPATDPNYSAGAWTIALDSGDPNQPFPAYDFGGYTTTLLVISKNITIAGPGASAMVITNSQGRRNDPFHPGRLFYIAPGANVTISGLTLTRPANADGDSVALEEFGAGAIFNDGGSVSISNCVITGVDTRTDGLDLHGSALFNYGGNAPATLYVSNCAFSNNQTDSSGAYDILNGNNAQDFNLKRFGGSQTLVVSNCSFTGDSGNGTVIINYAGNATIIGSSFSHSNGVSVINNEAVTVTYGAGGSDFYPASMKIVNSTVYDNQVLETIFTSGSFTIGDSTITGNQSTFADTHGRHFPGGIWVFGGTANIANTIVAGNTSVTGVPDVSGTFNSLGNNLIGATDYSTGWIASDLTGSITAGLLDPQLDPNGLQNNGGPTPTIQLQPTSPALGAGNVALALDPNNYPLLFDQRGAPRVVNGKIDIGAVQSNATVPPQGLVVTTDQDTDNPPQVTLRDAIAYAQFLGGTQTITFNNGSVSGATVNFYDGNPHKITLNGSELLIQSGALTIQAPGANVLTIDGNQLSRAFEIASAATVQLGGMTVTNGKVATTGNNQGGGILNNGALTMTDSTVSGNSVSGSSEGVGGGIFNNLGTLTILRGTFTGNSAAASGDGAGGGAICTFFGNVAIADSTFSANSASAGGAIDNIAGSVAITRTTISNNSVTGTASAFGGGISSNGTLTVFDSTISANTASAGVGSGGGGIYSNSTGITLVNSTVSGNSSSGTNQGGRGGGYYSAGDGTDVIVNNTFSNNSCTGPGNQGGGIYTDGHTNVKNTIVAGNRATAAPDVDGAFASQGFNLIGIGDGSTGFINGTNGDQVGTAAAAINPKLGLLANNGGPTATMMLLAGSLAINMGTDLATLASDSGATISLNDARAIVVGEVIQIEAEQMVVTATSPNNLKVTRGVNGTAQVTHSAGAVVNPAFDQRDQSFLRKIGGTVDIGAVELDIPGTITDVNPAQNSVVEGAASGTLVGLTAQAVDPDGVALTYSLTADTSGGGFTINPSSGVVTVANGNKINYATAPGHSYSVTVQASNGAGTSAASFTIAVTPAAHLGTANGSGTILTHNNQASFSFDVSNARGRDHGILSFNDVKGKTKLTSTEITSVTLLQNQATFSGKGTIANPAPRGKPIAVSFTAVATDNGTPGTKDTFQIQISSPYFASGNLTSGNIAVH